MIPYELDDALDIETAPAYGYPQAYALQPWRVMEGTSKITCVALGRADGQSKLLTGGYGQALREREGRPTSGWNLLFDVAYLIADGHYNEVNRIPWFDAMLLWKWLENGIMKERMPRWSLVDGAKRWLKDWPQLQAFLDMKAAEPAPGVNDAYWEIRGKLDAIATALISKRVWAELSEKKRRAASIEMQCLVPLARSWVMGVPMNLEAIAEAAPHIVEEMRELEKAIDVPGEVLRSPKQLQDQLFNKWSLEPIPKMVSEKTGAPSTDKKHLTYLAERDDRVLQILRYRELSTRYSKFMESPRKAAEYLGSNVVHPAPKIFSTLTGRMTYSSKTDKKYQTGVALHQWQQNQQVRALIEPPPGYVLVEFDASGQEDRLMAIISGDPMLKKVFTDDMDIHCYTAASITGKGYDDLMVLKAAKDPWLVGGKGMRQAGKVTNHSNKYRIGAASMRITAKVQYGLDITVEEARRWQQGFKRSFPGVPRYWDNAIQKAKRLGYAETLAGRTFLTPEAFFNSEKDRWSTQSRAINHPIQGSGADMKELAIAMLHKKFPELLFAFDLHDGLFFYVKQGTPMELLFEAQRALDNLDYDSAWGVQPTVPMIWDGDFGPNWGHMTNIREAHQEFL